MAGKTPQTPEAIRARITRRKRALTEREKAARRTANETWLQRIDRAGQRAGVEAAARNRIAAAMGAHRTPDVAMEDRP